MPPKGTAKCKLPVPLPEGYIVKNLERKEWRLGKIIGKGGFGLIYLASPHVGRPVEDDAAKHVIKVEYLENGPLFSELKFYQRAAKQENIKRWIEKKDLHYLGIPEYWGTGAAEYKGKSYRFMVMDRLGVDLQNILTHRKILPKGTVMHLGSQVLEVLEYMHENEYVHGDIKAANLMLGFKNPDEVYLADYGLSYRYCPDGTHKPYKPNPKKGHNGTIQFTSVDAHMGAAPSRRGDLQILCFCMLQWLCGKLPWEQNLKDPSAVQSAKTKLLEELPESVMKLATEDITREIAKFLTCINKLGYHEKPNYKDLKRILLSGMNSSGTACNASLNLSTAGCTSSKNAKVEPPELIKPSSKPVKPLNQNKEHETEANMEMNGSYVKCRDVQESKPSRLNKVHCKNETSKEQTNRRSAPLYPGTSFLEHEDDEYENSNAYSYTCLQQKTRGDVTDSFDHSSVLVPAFSDKAEGEIYRYVVAIVVLLIAIIISLYCL